MDYLHRPKRLLITGKSGTGKSEYFIRYIQAVAPEYRHVFIFDFEAEFSHRAGWQSVRTVEELNNPQHIQAYDYCEMYPGDLPTAFEFYCDYVFSIAKSYNGENGSILFCSDELQKIEIGTTQIPHDLTCLVETGRRYKVDTIFIAQQCNLVHNRLRNQVTEVVTFRHNDDRAIEWLVSYGFNEEMIRSREIGDYICRTDSGIEQSGNIFGGTPKPTVPEDDDSQHDPENGVDTDRGSPDSADIDETEDVNSGMESE